MSLIHTLLLILGLLILNGIFAAMEIAVISTRRSEVRRRAEEGHRGASLVRSFLDDSSRFLATIQIAITLSGFLASATGAAAIATGFADYLGRVFPWLGGSAEPLAVVLVTLAITYVTLVWGELVPKRLGLHMPYRVAYLLARPVAGLARFFGPVNALLTWSTNMTLRLVGVEVSTDRAKMTSEELRLLLRDEVVIPKTEKEIINRVFDFGEHLAREVMVPRTDMITLPEKATAADAVRLMAETGFSRLPVTGRNLDDITGIVSVKDVAVCLSRGESGRPVAEFKRDALFCPDTKLAVALLEEMQRAHRQMVILVDEYGGVAGLVTLEDLVEEIVGDLRHPGERAEFEQRAPKEYIIDGGLDIEAVNARLKLDLDTHGAFETIGGFMVSSLGRLPREGDKVVRNGVTYRVDKVDGRRIDVVIVTDERESIRREAEPARP